MSLNFLASVLISHLSHSSNSQPTTRASVIDSTGTFPLPTLAEILKVRVGQVRARAAAKPPPMDETADQCQEEEQKINVDVGRCLEMVGISRVFDVEGLWEVLREIGRSSVSSLDRDGAGSKDVDDETQSDHEVEIADSEEEEDELEGKSKERLKGEDTDEGIEIIIIDNMTQIINELFSRKEKSDGMVTIQSP